MLKKTILAGLLAVGISTAAIAQEYFNFDMHTNNGNIDHFSGSLIVGSGTNFSGILFSSVVSYMTPTNPNYTTTPIGVTNIQFNSATFGGTAGAYYIASMDFYYLDANNNAYRILGSGGSATSAPFDIFAATYNSSTNTYTQGSRIFNNEKAVNAGTTSSVGAFSATPLSAPEINSGSLPKGILLLVSLFIIFRKEPTAS